MIDYIRDMKKIFIALFCCVALVGNSQECISGDCENGQGTYTYANGSKYVGEYKDGEKHGQGTKTLADGSKYVGEWRGNKMYGQGTVIFYNGNKYVGEMKDDLSHGEGTFTFANGGNYVGEFKDGKMHGQGTLTRADGSIYFIGLWLNSKPINKEEATKELITLKKLKDEGIISQEEYDKAAAPYKKVVLGL